jgi:elongator complex protein 3
MIKDLFTNQNYQPDYLKIYPCMVIPKSELFDIYKRGEFQPYDDQTLIDILYEQIQSVPEWCRIDRIARDVPAPDIEAGSKVSNVRQILEEKLKKEKKSCRDIRAREIKDEKISIKNIKLVKREYIANEGTEFFLSYEDLTKNKLIALLRLRISNSSVSRRHFIKELKNAALIREVHVYGRQLAIGTKEKGKQQHLGWGGKLMTEAEKISKNKGYNKVAVIAGIGTREYYKKKGYKLQGSYMVKSI